MTPQQISRLQNMLAAAQQAHRSGLIAQAECIYRDIVKQAPEAWDVHHQLAILLVTSGRTREAIPHFRKIVKARPAHAVSHANLANALSESGQFTEALTEFQRALSLDKSLLGARIAMGEALRRAERSKDAVECFKSVLDQDKVNHAAFNGLGLAFRDLNDLPRALECFEHAVGLDPKNAEYHANFGVTLRRYKLDDLATEQFYEAVTLRPDWLDVIVLLAETLESQRRYDDAKESYDRALQLSPDNPELIERSGYVYLSMGDTNQALEVFNHALAEHPERIMALLGAGRCHMEDGSSSLAAEAFETAIRLHPDDHSGYFYLAASRKFKVDDPLIPKLKEICDTIVDEEATSAAPHFALGKIYDDCKSWDAAFEYYSRGNQIRNKLYKYAPDTEKTYFDSLISTFDESFIESHRNQGIASDLPIIIVGMPRSGTTLTEQIISSHPEVVGAGEVMFWGHAWESMPYLLETDQPYPDCIALMTKEQSLNLANKYTELLHKIAGPGSHPARITDKMPHNFLHLGLISLLFPNAKIIHCKRSPMDNCLSIFFQHFSSGHDYAYDLANIGHHYKQYERLMAHWHAVLPGKILDIEYEKTISDPEYWSRKLINHISLAWDDACLAPHKLERTVKTASHWQVRQPIYKTSVQRWKNYEKHLGALKEALGYQEEISPKA